MSSSGELFMRSGLFWCLFSEVRSNEINKHQNNTRHNESTTDYKMTIFTHRPSDLLARFAFCWWRHNRLLMASKWPDNCGAITRIMISNSCVWAVEFKFFSLILDSSVGLSAGIQSAGDLVSETLMGSNPAFSRGRQLVSFRFEYRLPLPEHRN